MSVTFVDTPIREVLFTFADFAGRSIVPGSGVTGSISAEIRDQPWDIAFQAILESTASQPRSRPPASSGWTASRTSRSGSRSNRS
jgi:type II secretory pathway component HofQ